jgi:hypothetical protein
MLGFGLGMEISLEAHGSTLNPTYICGETPSPYAAEGEGVSPQSFLGVAHRTATLATCTPGCVISGLLFFPIFSFVSFVLFVVRFFAKFPGQI